MGTSMGRKTRRQTREERRTPDTVKTPAPRPAVRSREPVAGRNTFKVAQAHRELSKSVGSVYSPRPRNSRTATIADPVARQPVKAQQKVKKKEVQKPEVSKVDLKEPPK